MASIALLSVLGEGSLTCFYVFYPVNIFFFGRFSLLLLRVKGRGCHTLLKPYETNCNLWIKLYCKVLWYKYRPFHKIIVLHHRSGYFIQDICIVIPLTLGIERDLAVCEVVMSASALCLHVDMELGVQGKSQQWPITPTASLGLPTMLTLEVEFCPFLNIYKSQWRFEVHVFHAFWKIWAYCCCLMFWTICTKNPVKLR